MVAELHCLNCARHLADVLLHRDGTVSIEPPGGQPDRPVLVASHPRGPRCVRCGGRALLERPLIATPRPRVA